MNADDYSNLVSKNFVFLAESYGMSQGAVRIVDKGYCKDECYVSRFSGDNLQIDIGFKHDEYALIVTIKYLFDELKRNERSVYFEPLIEFLSSSKDLAIVPYIKHSSSISKIESAMERRKHLFADGAEKVLAQVATKLHDNMDKVKSVTVEQIKEYHNWVA